MDSTEFSYWNTYSRTLANKMKDTTSIAESYWDTGNFYYKLRILDSSFYYYQKAYDYYNQVDSAFYAGRILLNMAVIQSNIKDYTGSEITTIEAIKRFEPVEAKKQLYIAYNNLGIVANGMKEYSKAINYHKEAIEQIEEKSRSTKYASSLNNIGVVLKDSGNYGAAIEYYTIALEEDSLRNKNARLYAMLLDNITYSRMKLGDNNNLLKDFQEARSIRESIDNIPGILASDLHLGEYYLQVEKDTNRANEIFSSVKEVSVEVDSKNSFLEALLFLTVTDGKNQNKHLKKYIAVNDSLLGKERAIRNKFTRIKFETDQFIKENKALNYQQKYLIIGFSALFIILTLVFIIRNQRINNKKLILQKQQRETNEEIYNLLLTQQQKVEEGKEKEKFRISSELHDGILSKLFGIRMTLESLNDEPDLESVKTRSNNLDELQKLEGEIRSISHELVNDNEAKEVDLIEIIQEFTRDKERISGIKISVKVDKAIEWESVINKIKIHLYRIIQELVFNAMKYSEAEDIIITFKSMDGYIQLEVFDNGIGFDVGRTRKGIGINNVFTRTADLKGRVDIKSDTSGTKFIIVIPY